MVQLMSSPKLLICSVLCERSVKQHTDVVKGRLMDLQCDFSLPIPLVYFGLDCTTVLCLILSFSSTDK